MSQHRQAASIENKVHVTEKDPTSLLTVFPMDVLPNSQVSKDKMPKLLQLITKTVCPVFPSAARNRSIGNQALLTVKEIFDVEG